MRTVTRIRAVGTEETPPPLRNDANHQRPRGGDGGLTPALLRNDANHQRPRGGDEGQPTPPVQQ
jgi:hypothetical protein